MQPMDQIQLTGLDGYNIPFGEWSNGRKKKITYTFDRDLPYGKVVSWVLNSNNFEVGLEI